MGNKDTRNKIIASAIKLFAKSGFNAISVNDIAKDIGISSPSFYYHFENKAALIREVLGRINAARSESYTAILLSDASDAAKLKSIVHLHIKSYKSDAQGMKIFQHILLDEDAETLETFMHDVYADAYLRISRCAATVDSSRDGYYTLYLIMSLSLGYHVYMPLQNMIRRLTKFERETENITNLVLNLIIPSVDWLSIALLSP